MTAEDAGRVVDAWASFCADNNLDDTVGFDDLSDAIAALRESSDNDTSAVTRTTPDVDHSGSYGHSDA